jgi:hypothetical protein
MQARPDSGHRFKHKISITVRPFKKEDDFE